MQPLLIELADLRVLDHDPVGEIHDIVQIEIRVGEGLRREQILDAQLGALGSQGQQPHHAHIVHVTDQKYGRQARHVDVAGLAVLLGQAGKWNPRGSTVQRPGRGAAAHSALEFGIGVPGVRAPLRIVLLLEQPASVDRHELRELRMHARTVQTLVIVFPEYLPIALDGLEHDVADGQILQRPRVEPVERHIENLLEGRRVLGQRNEYESVPFPDLDRVQREIGDIEAARMPLR